MKGNNLKLFFSLVVTIAWVAVKLSAQLPGVFWAHKMGNAGGKDEAKSVCLDAAGNSYTTGNFVGECWFESTQTFSVGQSDAFVVKQDPAGNVVWAFSCGGTGLESGNSIWVDAAGNIYLTGQITSTAAIDMDPSAGVFTISGSGGTPADDIFVAKYNGNLQPGDPGFFQWAFALTSANMGDFTCSVRADAAGYVFVAGHFGFTMDMDPSASTSNLTASGTGTDVFIAKYNGNLVPSNAGFFQWAFKAGTAGNESAVSMTLDAPGNIYLTGLLTTTLAADMDPSVNTNTITGAGFDDIFVAKYNATLLPSDPAFFQWAFALGGTGYESAADVEVDALGFVYLTGQICTCGPIDFDPAPATFTLTGNGDGDLFVSKYNGLLLPSDPAFFSWAFSAGGAVGESGNAMALDGAGNLLLTGKINGTADMDPAAGSGLITGNQDIFLVKYNVTVPPSDPFFYQWAFVVDNPAGLDLAADLAVNAANGVVLTGSLDGFGWVDLDPSAGTQNHKLFGHLDVFVASYNYANLPSQPAFYQSSDLFGNGSGGLNMKTVQPDAAGNVYAAGSFGGKADLDPGPGVFYLQGEGWSDVCVAKYNSTGALTWAFGFGTSGLPVESAWDLAVDAAGYIYVTGALNPATPVDLDPSAGVFMISGGAQNMFAAKYNGNLLPTDPGFFQWAFAATSPMFSFGISLDVDNAGFVYIAGHFNGTTPVDFDPSANVNTLTNPTGGSTSDIFICKYNGNLLPSNPAFFQWAFSAGTTLNDRCTAIDADENGMVYIAGYLNGTGTMDMDPSAGTNILTGAGQDDLFAAKYNGLLLPSDPGFCQWAFRAGGANFEQAHGVEVNSAGEVFICGMLGTNTDLDPSVNSNVVSGTTSNFFVAKYNGNLTPSNTAFHLWSFGSSGGGYEELVSIALSSDGSFIVAGRATAGSFDADPSANTFFITPLNQDFIVLKYDGNLLPSSTSFFHWGFSAGPQNTDQSHQVKTRSGQIYLVGTFMGNNIDFDPTGAVYPLTSSANGNGSSGFLAVYGNVPFPLAELNLYGWTEKGQVNLEWQFTGQEPPVQYQVERLDANQWVEIARLSQTQFTDAAALEGINRYRVTGFTQAGLSLESNIFAIHPAEGTSVLVWPNPTHDRLFIRGAEGPYLIVNPVGQTIASGIQNGAIEVEGIAQGIYFLMLEKQTIAIRIE